jgi:hypothetical protein
VLGVRLVVERIDFHVTGRAIETDRLAQRLVRLELDDAHSSFACAVFELGQEASPDAEAARCRRDPHALEVGVGCTVELQRAAADRLLS